jgi:hypothetical protein
MEHKVRSQNSESRSEEKKNQNRVFLDYRLLETDC